MSYDLNLLECAPGEDADALHERCEQLDEDEEQGIHDPAVAARNRRIADALLAANPALSEFSPAERDWELELTDPEGLQITLFSKQASITFPYWDSLDSGKLMEQIQDVARIINAETGWLLFDPQIEEVVDPAQGTPDITEAFDYGRDRLRKVVGDSGESQSRPPWWKRLFGG